MRDTDLLIVGAAQLVQRPDDPMKAMEPLEMMVDVAERAALDADAQSLGTGLDVVAVVRGAWSYSDPGRIIASRLGSSASTMLTAVGGQSPQTLVNELGSRIVAGSIDVALVVGAEAIHSRKRLRQAQLERPTTRQTGVDPDETHGTDEKLTSPFEESRGVNDTVIVYPLFEDAFRAARDETHAEHRSRLGQLWHAFNQVAVDNPYAWTRRPMTADEIVTPSPDNRMVGWPYTKSMNSNWYLDQAAAFVLCSVRAARKYGVPRDRWVFVHAGSQASDTTFVSNRHELFQSPAIRAAARSVFQETGISVNDVAHVDLYSCFPSAVQIAATEIGFPLDRQLTVTGGLTFVGGPYSNYVTHSIATMANVLRRDQGSLGLITANGGFLNKHAIGLYSTEPPSAPFRAHDAQGEVDIRFRAVAESHSGSIAIEASTVLFGREGPERAVIACRTTGGARTWGSTTDPNLMASLIEEECNGTSAMLSRDGVVEW